MNYRFVTADVFTNHLFGGNPLAIFPDARGLNDHQMQRIAREFNLSETVFVLPPDDPAHTRKLRIFTPGTELPFAGHPTVGAAVMLAAMNEIEFQAPATSIVFEEGVGPVPVLIESSSHNGNGGARPGRATLTAARPPEYGPSPPDNELLTSLLGLSPGDLLSSRWQPEAVSCGVPFLFIPLKSLDAVARAELDLALWRELLAHWWAKQVFVFARGGERKGTDYHGRMFAPNMGIAEDPATGAAATAFAGYLAPRVGLAEGTLDMVLEQGFEMGRPSILRIASDFEGGHLKAIRVGGEAVKVSEGTLRLPD